MAKVFVSYSRKDIEFAKQLTAELQKSELDFWIDWEGIPPTVDWWREIEKGIEEADVFIFLISSDSSASKVCGKEIECAIKNAKRIIPLVVREIKGDEAPQQLSHLNWIFFRESDDFDAAVKKLMTAIQTDYEWAATHRRLQVKALDWERNSKDSGFLLRGMDLLDAEQDLATNTSKDPHPTDLQREYVLASRKATDRQRRILTSISIAGVIALAALAVFALVKAGEATNNAAIAQAAQVTAESNASVARTAEANAEVAQAKSEVQAKISRAGELAAQSVALRDKNFQLSLLLGIEAYTVLPTVQSMTTLLDNAQSHPQLHTFLQVSNEGGRLDFSPDGKTLAIGSTRNSVLLWDITTDQPIGQPLIGHSDTDILTEIAFSPNSKFLAVGGASDTIILWDLITHKPIVEQLLGYNVAFSPEGKVLATGSLDGTIRLWDLTTQTLIRQLTSEKKSVNCLAFSADSKVLASGHPDGTVILWEMETGTPINELFTGNVYSLHSIAFSPDGKILASATMDRDILLWDMETDTPISPPLSGHSSSVWAIAFSPEGKTLVSGSSDKTIIVWDMTRRRHATQTLTGHPDSVQSIALSVDGKTLASVGSDKTIIWNIEARTPIGQTLTDDTGFTNSQAFSPDGSLVASVDSVEDYSRIVLWDTATLKRAGEFLTQPNDYINSIAFSPDTKILAAGGCGKFNVDVVCTEGELILWDVPKRRRINSPLTPPSAAIGNVVFSPNGKFLASVSLDGTLGLWDAATGKLLFSIGEGLDQYSSAAFSPDSELLALGTGKGDIVLWNRATQQQIGQPLSGHSGSVSAIAFSPDRKILVSGGNDMAILFWDVSKGKLIGRSLTTHKSFISSLSFSPDGKILASGDTEIILWDVSTRQPIGQPLDGFYPFIFSPDGKTMFSHARDGIMLWNIDPQFWIDQTCRRAHRNLTSAEWTQYFPDEEYRKTCEQWPLESGSTPTLTP